MRNLFPEQFTFGVADADLQVVGEKSARDSERSEETMWSWFARTSGKCHQDTGPEEGVDRFNCWQEDIDLMRSLGLRTYRTSVSMARLLTKSGDLNAKAARWYESYFQALKKAGISIHATLYHWELPQFLNEQGGWKNRVMVEWLSKHAEAVFQSLGEYISEYYILNEPWCSAFLGYHQGVHAPGETSLNSGLLAAHNLLLAQGVAFEKLKSLDRNLRVSTVLNLGSCYAASPSIEDARAARYADIYHNAWFLDPIFSGRYPEDGMELYSAKLPRFGKADMALMHIGPRLHALGINYYNGTTARYDERADTRFAAVRNTGEATNDLGWPLYVPPVYREGLYDLLQQVWFGYRASGLQRIYITENGMALAPSKEIQAGVMEDRRRVEYLKAHIGQVASAVARGIPVQAYFLWTLMDNYEWAEGHRPESCFGIVHVDRKTMKRTRKDSAIWYSENLLKAAYQAKSTQHVEVSALPVVSAQPPVAVVTSNKSGHILRRPAVVPVASTVPKKVATPNPVRAARAKKPVPKSKKTKKGTSARR